MAHRNRRRRSTFLMVLFLSLSAAGLGLTQRAIRQSRLDRELETAIKENDPIRVIRFLDQGANPNIRIPVYSALLEILAPRRTAWQRLLDTLQGKRSGAEYETLPAVYYAVTNSTSCMGIFIHLQESAIVKALIEAGADPNAATDDGDTVLMLVARAYESSECSTLKFLIAHGADVNARTREGRSVRTIARSSLNYSRNGEILQRAGAK